jgi:WD40 repeat protein
MRILQGHRRTIRAVAYAPGDPATLAAAGDDRSVRLWNPGTGQNWATLAGHRGAVLALAFSPDGGLLASGGRDQTLFLWDVALQRQQQCVPLHEGPIAALAFAPDGQTVLAVPRNQRALADPGLLLCYTVRQRQAPERLLWGGGVQAVAFGPGLLAVADDSRAVEVQELAGRRRRSVLRVAGRVRCMAFAPGPGPPLLAVASGKVVECWDATGPERRTRCRGHRAEVHALAFTPDGRTLLTGAADRTVRRWDVRSGRELGAWNWQLGRVQALAVSPDGTTAAAGGEKPDLVVWDLE